MSRAACRTTVVLGMATVAAACNLWPGGLGRDETPYAAAAAPRLTPTPLEGLGVLGRRTLDEELTRLQERAPEPAGGTPKVVRDTDAAPEPMSVEAMRVAVLRGNLALDVALLEPELARLHVGVEEGKFDAILGSTIAYGQKDLPRLDGPLVGFSSDDPDLAGSTAKLTEVEQQRRTLDFDLGVTVPLPTGGAIAVDGVLAQKEVTDPQRFEQYVAATRFSFSQPLLRGAGTAANLASIRIARTDLRAAEVRTKLACLATLARAEKAYWRLWAARAVLDVRTEQHRLASENLRLVRRRVEQGITPRIEITRAEQGLVKQLEALVVAETQWRLRQRALKTFLADERFPLDGTNAIHTTTPPRLVGFELDPDALVQRALAERLDLIELELQLLRDDLEVERRDNLMLPLANLEFRYGILDRDRDLGSAWQEQWDVDHDELGVGLSFELPLTNQRRRAERDLAVLQRMRRFATKAAREQAVRQEVLDAIDVLRQDWQRIAAARQSVVVAGANYDAELRQFQQGLRTMREVFEALTDVGAAQRAEIAAITDYQVAQVDIAFATGTLLGYARVDLSPIDLPTTAPAAR
jgi:outer membrane protein